MGKTEELLSMLENQCRSYEAELEELQNEMRDLGEKKSSIIVKTINGNQYYYEQWRDGKHVRGKALGKVAPGAVCETEIEIEKRRDIMKRVEEIHYLLETLREEKAKLKKQVLNNLFDDSFRFEVFWKNELSARVSVNRSKVNVSRFIIHPIRQIFSSEHISRNQLNEILKLRCFEEGRPDIKDKLASIGLTEYIPIEIVKRTHGVSYNDYIWIRFPGEKLRAEDVLVR
ncbi:MAG: hypothetical protein IKO61_06595 [Lachnospiraceae bacterium]|nr:hypothetical protein [Lachnospiraceae bacterium]